MIICQYNKELEHFLENAVEYTLRKYGEELNLVNLQEIEFTDSREMFDDLWKMWMDYVLLAPVKGTDREELDYDELYAELSEDKKAEYEQKRQELLELSGLSD